MDYRGLALFSKGPTARHLSRGGRPAAALPHEGMPAYESETGKLFVMENVVVFPGSPTSPPMALPYSYMMVVARTQGDGLTALHDDPDAVWKWRPILYQLGHYRTQALGSQQELEYRRGLWDVEVANGEDDEASTAYITSQVLGLRRQYGRIPPMRVEPGERGFRLPKNARKRLHRQYVAWLDGREPRTYPWQVANERAKRILRENLAPQQVLDLDRRGGFYVRGEVNSLYYVDVGNGFSIVHPITHQHLHSFCLHPDGWLPPRGRRARDEARTRGRPRLRGRAARGRPVAAFTARGKTYGSRAGGVPARRALPPLPVKASLAAPTRRSPPASRSDGYAPVSPAGYATGALRGSRPSGAGPCARPAPDVTSIAGDAISEAWRSCRTVGVSFRVVAKVLDHSSERLARRLIMIVLAETASDDGIAWLDQQTIAQKALLTRTHVSETITKMEAESVLEIRTAKRKIAGRTHSFKVYRLSSLPGLDEPNYDRLGYELDCPFTTSELPTPSTSDLPVDDVGSTELATSDLTRKSEVCPLVEPPLGDPSLNLPAKVDRKAVSPAEGSLAVEILREWNQQAGQNLTSRDWLSKFVMRIREYPDLTVADHAHVIAAALAKPWWKGPAAPSVVYGSGAQFERSILAAKAGPLDDRRRTGPGGGPTPEEMIDRARRLREDGR